MSVKTSQSQSSLWGVIILAFMSLISSAAYPQSRPTTPATQLWADPGALEKARKEGLVQAPSNASAPSPTLPAPSKASADRSSASSIQKPTTNIQSSSIPVAARWSKSVHALAEPKAPHRIKQREAQTNPAKSPGRILASGSERKLPVASGHDNAGAGFPPHAAIHAPNAPARARDQHSAHERAHERLTEQQDEPSQASSTGEFDPIYGYSNMISVAY
jgi:hypothetical protein